VLAASFFRIVVLKREIEETYNITRNQKEVIGLRILRIPGSKIEPTPYSV
jgi:hypothetical protein